MSLFSLSGFIQKDFDISGNDIPGEWIFLMSVRSASILISAGEGARQCLLIWAEELRDGTLFHVTRSLLVQREAMLGKKVSMISFQEVFSQGHMSGESFLHSIPWIHKDYNSNSHSL